VTVIIPVAVGSHGRVATPFSPSQNGQATDFSFVLSSFLAELVPGSSADAQTDATAGGGCGANPQTVLVIVIVFVGIVVGLGASCFFFFGGAGAGSATSIHKEQLVGEGRSRPFVSDSTIVVVVVVVASAMVCHRASGASLAFALSPAFAVPLALTLRLQHHHLVSIPRIAVVQLAIAASLVVGSPPAKGLGPVRPAVASVGQWSLELGVARSLGFVANVMVVVRDERAVPVVVWLWLVVVEHRGRCGRDTVGVGVIVVVGGGVTPPLRL